jgi:hypothetical protein
MKCAYKFKKVYTFVSNNTCKWCVKSWAELNYMYQKYNTADEQNHAIHIPSLGLEISQMHIFYV